MVSVLGFIISAYLLAVNFGVSFDTVHFIYVSMLVIVLCNSVVGILLTYEDTFGKRRRFRAFKQDIKSRRLLLKA